MKTEVNITGHAEKDLWYRGSAEERKESTACLKLQLKHGPRNDFIVAGTKGQLLHKIYK